jgi:N-terminal acetyltransferase B complex non-catalytic subunit
MNQSRPRLKNGVDIQLQSAFSEGNWSLVVRLAENRFRSLKDEYYSVSMAPSQLPEITRRFPHVAR